MTRRVLVPLVWGGGFWALARVDVVVERLPSLGVLRGGLGAVLLAVSVGVALAHTRRRWQLGWRPPGTALFVASALVLLIAGLHYTSQLRVTGDEPHYLLMAQSLWRDGDLDLRNNYQCEEFLEYTPGPIRPHYGAPRADGRPFPAHSPGLSMLLAPAYGVAKRPGTVVVLALAAAALAWQVRALALRVTRDRTAATVAWAVAIGPPVALYGFHVYTEVPAALALATSLRLLLGRPGAAGAAVAALAASTLPWLHLKMGPAAAGLGLLAAYRLRGRALAAFAAVVLLMALGFAAHYWLVFGTPNPLTVYGGMPRRVAGLPRWDSLLGLGLDRSFGLLPHAPAFVLALPGLGYLCRRWREPEILAQLLLGVAVAWPALTWRMWWGGQCPPGRFLVPLVPLLGLAVAVRLAEPLRGIARWRWTLLALGYTYVAFAIFDPGKLLLVNRGSRPTRLWAALSSGTPVERYLPSLVAADGREIRVAVVWLGALAVLLSLDHLARRRKGVDRLFRGLGLPLVLLLSVGVLVDVWARPSEIQERHGGSRNLSHVLPAGPSHPSARAGELTPPTDRPSS